MYPERIIFVQHNQELSEDFGAWFLALAFAYITTNAGPLMFDEISEDSGSGSGAARNLLQSPSY